MNRQVIDNFRERLYQYDVNKGKYLTDVILKMK